MSLSTQKSMQSYLERHEIGKLFEDMMAKLIKEMPNEPIIYLIKMLQKINQRIAVSPGENTFPSSILYKSGIGLTGSSIPLKYSKDPQVVLPGSKPMTSTWMESSGKEDSADSENVRSRSYEKPWLPGSKQSKGVKEKKDSGKTEPPSWNTDTKSATKSIDDLFEQKGGELKKSIVVNKSPVKENQRTKKTKDRKWSEESPIDEKENHVPHIESVINIDKKDSFDDELKIESRPLSANRKKICSPKTYSKFKKKSSKKKSLEQKQKLQALLLTDQTKATKDDLDDSTDYEGDNVIEDTNELQVEGARSKNSSGLKRTHQKPANDNIKVSVCSRCAQIMGDSNLKQSTTNGSLNMLSSDNEDFASVSQLDEGKSYKPVWPSKSEDVIGRTGKSKLSNSPKKGVLKNKFSSNKMPKDDKSDFFEKNNPLRSKTKRFAGDFTSDNESDFGEDGVKVKLSTSKAWQQQLEDTGSEADVDEESQELEMKGHAWKQKVAKSDIISDI